MYVITIFIRSSQCNRIPNRHSFFCTHSVERSGHEYVVVVVVVVISGTAQGRQTAESTNDSLFPMRQTCGHCTRCMLTVCVQCMCGVGKDYGSKPRPMGVASY